MLHPYFSPKPFTLLLLLAGLVFSPKPTHAQAPAAPVSHSVFLLGNTATRPLTESRAAALRRQFQQTTGPFTVVHLGDVAGPDGLPDPKTADAAALKAATTNLDRLLALVADLPQGRLVVIPGDRDWANSGKDGYKAVRRLEAYFKEKQPNATVLLPGHGCPGPEIIDLAPDVRLVAVNSAWFTHPWARPEEPDTDCKTLSPEEFNEQLEDAISDRGRRHVLVVGHHPAVSEGVYGGRIPIIRHLVPFQRVPVPLPIIGSVYAAFRQNVGTPRDRAYPGYTAYAKGVLATLRESSGVVYASAHDYSLQLHQLENSYQLVSGSLTQHQHVGRNRRALFNDDAEGLVRLDYAPDGNTTAHFFTFANETDAPRASARRAGEAGDLPREVFSAHLFRAPCAPTTDGALPNDVFACDGAVSEAPLQFKDAPKPGLASTLVVPGPQYKAGPVKLAMIGPLYRADWTTPVRVPTLDLATMHGGLHAFGRGGGRQTTSLKFVGGDSLEYVFRSVDKDLQGALPPELRNTVVADILRDVTATSQPYSALVCSALLDATDIRHARPALYRLPDDPAALGTFRSEFAGLVGTLEDRPKDPQRGQPGFAGADDVTRSFGLFRKIYKDHDTRVDEQALAKARAFDMLVADFGKHEDNWRWAGYKSNGGKTTTYQPIPRDRDQSFTRWNGALTWLANREWAVPSIENFGAEFRDMESLNWPARHLDRLLLTSVTREQWQEAARYMQGTLSESVIVNAANQLPQELRTTTGQDIQRKLRSRLADLPRALDEYYLMLARFVDVVGSNKAEVFRAERLASGDVRVLVFDKQKDSDEPDGPAYYDRTFKRGETKEIRLYALDGKDVVQVTGTAGRSILLRIIGGDGQDRILDDSRVSGLRRYTKVYDERSTDLTAGPETNDNRADRPGINHYNHRDFEYDGYTPLASLFYNANDGYGVGAGFSFDKQGWRKPDFKAQYGVYGQITSEGNRQAMLFLRYRHIFGQWDFAGLAEYGNYYPFYNFFGLGNDTKKDNGLFDQRFYRARYSGPRGEVALERTLLRSKSRFRAGMLFEDFTSETPANTVLADATDNPVPATQRLVSTTPQRLAGARLELDLDFRDRNYFARRGTRFYLRHTSYQQLTAAATDTRHQFHVTEGFGEWYGTARIGLPTTLVVKAGGAKVYGAPNEAIPFYKFPQLGQVQNLRGYVRNRFTGDAIVYLNSELRLALGQVRSSVVPFSYGIFGFFDAGRAYVKNAAPGTLKMGYGAGAYVSPFVDRFAFGASVGFSDEETALIQFSAGFRIDK